MPLGLVGVKLVATGVFYVKWNTNQENGVLRENLVGILKVPVAK